MKKRSGKNYVTWILVGVVIVCIGIVAVVEADAATLETAMIGADSIRAIAGSVIC